MHSLSPIRFGTASLVTASLGPNDPKVGDRARIGDEDYLFVYNNGGASINAGHAVTVSAVTGYSVTVSTTVSAMVAVGVCKHATITTGAYGWVVTRGFSSYEAGGVVSASENLSVAADGVWVTSSGITGIIYGKAMVATGSGGSASAYFSFGG